MAVDSPKKGRRPSGTRGGQTEPLEPPPSTSTTSVADPQRNWAESKDSAPYLAAQKLYPRIVKAYRDKEEQQDRIFEYWNVYNAQPDANQQYTGNSMGYIPVVRDCINARSKRALSQLFPSNGKHVDAVASDNETPYTALSLLEYYIRKLKLKSVIRSDLVAGDTTGQWNLMVDWTKNKHRITKLVRKNPILTSIDGEDIEDLEIEDPTDEIESTEDETITEEGPEVVDFATEDLAVLPPTCMDLQKAAAVSVRLRMSAENVREMVDQGVFILPKGTDIEGFCYPNESMNRKDPEKKAIHDAGIRTDGTERFAMIYMTYAKLEFDDGMPQSGIIYYGGQDVIVGIIKNPLWSGKIPIISNPVERLQGSFFGRSKIEPVKFMQWACTDFFNMGTDSAMYSVLPIYKADPLKVPNWASLTMGLAAVWPVAPGDLEPMVTPALWKDSAQVCDMIERRIWQSLDVNEMMMGRMPAGRKNNAMIGGVQQEQMVSISDHASRYEEVQLEPLAEMLFEFDQQFRTADLMIVQRGEIGVKAKVETVPVMQWGTKYFFRWLGTEFMRGMQQLQQQIAWMNVLKGVPPQALNGRQLDVTPILEAGTENIFGPDMAPRILVDKRNQFTISPDVENEMLHNGFVVDVHEADNDPEHLQSHMRAAGLATDPLGLFKAHMAAHMAQMQRKREMQMAQSGGQRMPGAPGGPGGGPGAAPPQGVAGTPRPGAIPAMPRGTQQPPGAIHADQMVDPNIAGRG